MPAGEDERTFEVVAWPADRRLVVYVPEIETATTVTVLREADGAARSLISELTGLPEARIRCDVRLGRGPGAVPPEGSVRGDHAPPPG